MKILLAIDGSEYSIATVKEVARRTFLQNTKINIISVYEKPSMITAMGPLNVPNEDYLKADHYALQTALNSTKHAAQILLKKNPGLKITTCVIEGSPKTAILQKAETFDADLIVVGSHGYGFWGRAFLGSTSDTVIHHAHCSVLVVRKKSDDNEATG